MADPTTDRARNAGDPAATTTPSQAELARIDAYWRAANYLSVGQIYLLDNA
jgi:xylulose-5-phosphate/fructose-6-phosphate phosphoketolase